MLMAVGSLGSFKRPGRLPIAQQNSCHPAEGGGCSSSKKQIRDFARHFDRESAHPLSRRETNDPRQDGGPTRDGGSDNELNGVHCALSGILLRYDS
jgi:hypothetical protein